MWTDLPEGVRAKLTRSREHLQELTSEILKGSESGWFGYKYICDHEDLIIKSHLPRSQSIRWSVMAGEVVHQMRSSLDHLIWAMVPSPKEGVTGFPILKKNFETRGLQMIAGINNSAIDVIRGLQPSNGNPESDALALLEELWVRDKHRYLSLCLPAITEFKVDYEYPDGGVVSYPMPMPRVVDDDVDIIRMRQPDDYTDEVKIGLTLGAVVEFEEPKVAQGRPVVEVLKNLWDVTLRVTNTLSGTMA